MHQSDAAVFKLTSDRKAKCACKAIKCACIGLPIMTILPIFGIDSNSYSILRHLFAYIGELLSPNMSIYSMNIIHRYWTEIFRKCLCSNDWNTFIQSKQNWHNISSSVTTFIYIFGHLRNQIGFKFDRKHEEVKLFYKGGNMNNRDIEMRDVNIASKIHLYEKYQSALLGEINTDDGRPYFGNKWTTPNKTFTNICHSPLTHCANTEIRYHSIFTTSIHAV